MASRTCKCLRWAFRVTDWEPTCNEWIQILQSIQEEETTKVMRFVFRDDCKYAAIGRMMLRASIASMFNVAWSEIRLDRSPNGKPFLANPLADRPSFNITHDGDFVLLATDCGQFCGVDVMKVQFRSTSSQRSVQEFLELMKKQFSVTEWRSMERAEGEMEKLTLFYRYWCLKESYVKATGIGIHNDLSSVDFRYDNDDCSTWKPTLFLNGKESSDQWRFSEYRLNSDHVAAVCTGAHSEQDCQRRQDNLEFENISVGELLRSAQYLHSVDEGMWGRYLEKSYKKKA